MKPPSQTLKILKDEEWCFHKVPRREQAAAWHWEIERTHGSSGVPWLHLTDSEKEYVDSIAGPAPLHPVEEYKLETATARSIRQLSIVNTYYAEAKCQLHLLRVNWNDSKANILEELTAWVNKHWTTIPPEKREVDKGGRKDKY